jgi:two-component system, cell cycle response regulator
VPDEPIRTLLVEDDDTYARLVTAVLNEQANSFLVEHVDRVSHAIELLDERRFDVVLLDLSLPDGSGLDTLFRAAEHSHGVPLVVISGTDDEHLAVQAVKIGAQDYLIKGEVENGILPRSLRYAIERYRMLTELRQLSLEDTLTGLNNRRGFMVLANHHIHLCDRSKRGMHLVYLDIDSLQWVNRTFGYHEGDNALIDVAHLLEQSHRHSDVIARIGGDEFAVLAIDTRPDSGPILEARLHQQIGAFNADRMRRYGLALSIGVERYDPEHPCGVEDLIDRAAASMAVYRHNKQKE